MRSSLALALPLAVLFAASAHAQGRNVVEVSLGGSSFVELTGAVGKVTLTDPNIAEVSSAANGLLVIGRRVGETSLMMFGPGGQSSYLVKVTLPARAIMSELSELFPREEIHARAVGGALVLTGTVSSSPIVTQAEELVLGYLRSPSIAGLGVKPHVINLLQVRDKQQVLLEVKFAEVNRRSLREMGVNAVAGDKEGRVGAAVGRRGVIDTDPRGATEPRDALSPGIGRPSQTFNVNDNAQGAFFIGKPDGDFPFSATLSLLATRNLSRTLAEPTLVAMSGQTASFLAGGEFPFEKSSGFGNTTVEFKKFGIELMFTPTVLADGTVQLRTTTNVSAPDPTLTIVVNGVSTQGFKRRSSDTTVRMRDGQSFAIAGMLSDEVENLIQKVPGFGDLPVLGILFSSKSYNRRETELVVVVTVKLVEPLDEGDVPPLPGENNAMDPTDLELFLLNIPEPDTTESGAASRARGRRLSRTPRTPVGQAGFWR